MFESDLFINSFLGMFTAITKIFLLAIIGGILVRKKVLSNENIKALSDFTVKVLLPALIFSNIISTFDPYKIDNWWILPLVGLIAPVVFMGITAIFYLPNLKSNLNKLPLSSLQNAGYLVLPIGQLLYPENFETFALYVFLLIIGYNPTLWSIGKLFITQTDKQKKIRFTDLITPPLVLSLFAIFIVFIKLNKYIPVIILEPIELLGSATIPVATFILGATLGSVSLKMLPKFSDIFKITFIKLVLSPILVIIILLSTSISTKNPLMADFLIIEASAAPAANLIVMVRKYGGDVQTIGGLMLISYFLAIFFMPFWIAIWKYIS